MADECAHSREALISLRGLSHHYLTVSGSGVEALRNLDLDVREGEFLVIAGPSGCGKSTLLQMVAGLIRPTAGACRIQGEEIRGPRSDIGMVFQNALLMPWADTLENILFPARLQHLEMSVARERAIDLVRLVGLEGFEDKYPAELSGGMQQRAGIARALIHDPKILLMDEPFGALDALTREKLNLQLQGIWHKTGQTVMFVTHSVAEAVTLGSRVVVMTERPGRIAKIIDIDLERPRRMSVLSSAKAVEAQVEIRSLLGVV